MDMVDLEVSGFCLNINLFKYLILQFKYWIFLMLAFFFDAQIGDEKTQHLLIVVMTHEGNVYITPSSGKISDQFQQSINKHEAMRQRWSA